MVAARFEKENIITIKGKSGRYNELDALRGVAALMVVLFHFTMNNQQFTTVFKFGTTGVDLFFMISGFVIFMSFDKISGSKQFIINRVSRLYPGYWAAVTFTFIVMLIVKLMRDSSINVFYQIKKYTANLTMLQFYFRVPNIDASYWTLLIELLFYAVMLLLYHFKLLKQINIIGIFTTLTVTISAHIFYNFYIFQKVFKFMPLLQFVPLFLAGINFYKLYTNRKSGIKNWLIILLCLLSQIILFKQAGRSKSYINVYEYAGMLSLYFTLFTAFINNKLHFIVNSITLFLGKISYALYLIHEYISIKVIIPVLVNKFHIPFWAAAIGITLPIVIILATLLTFWIEIPFGKKLKKKMETYLI